MRTRFFNFNPAAPLFSLYAPMLLFSFSLLAAELLLARILSVIFYHHLVFFIVSLVMFGLTVGGMVVFLRPQLFPQERLFQQAASFTGFSSLGFIFSFLGLFWLPAVLALWHLETWTIPALFLLLSLPFVAFGIVLSLCLTRFPEKTAKVYGCNLIGSALGCLGIIFFLDRFNPGGIIFFLAYTLVIASLLFSLGSGAAQGKSMFVVLSMAFLWLFVWSSAENVPWLLWSKGKLHTQRPLYDKWNFHSYVRLGSPGRKPFGWGFSHKIAGKSVSTEELMITIDNDAGTVLTKFDDLAQLEYLKDDVTSVAYHMGRLDDVLVLGVGGGRDAITAAVFGAKKITGVEINKNVHDIAFHQFDFFSKGIKKYPHIRFAVEEGRSFVLRSPRRYDMIQVSLVDSFAAIASGAFALTENSLYSTDAWVNFLGHLKDRGLLTFSVWYQRDDPKYVYRLLNVASRALRFFGVENVRSHVALISNKPLKEELRVGTLITSRSPLSPLDLLALEKACESHGFEMILSPAASRDATMPRLLNTTSERQLMEDFAWDLRPPSDDRPFFFYFARLRDVFSLRADGPPESRTLKGLLFAIVSFGIFGIIIPLARFMKRSGAGDFSWGAGFYFFAVGLGFMFVEMALMQRLGIFFGHPLYGMSVVLFSLLLFSGIGSMTLGALTDPEKIVPVFVFFLLFLLAAKTALPGLLLALMPHPLISKIAVSVGVVAVAGLLMGMPFPLGLRHLAVSPSAKIACWSINGFASVCGSAVSTLLLVHFGFQKVFIFSFFCYAAACAFLSFSLRKAGA